MKSASTGRRRYDGRHAVHRPANRRLRAERDAQSIFNDIAERSPEGAARWWDALQATVRNVAETPCRYGFAAENAALDYDLREQGTPTLVRFHTLSESHKLRAALLMALCFREAFWGNGVDASPWSDLKPWHSQKRPSSGLAILPMTTPPLHARDALELAQQRRLLSPPLPVAASFDVVTACLCSEYTKMMEAQQAFESLDPESWAATSVTERLALIGEVLKNLELYAHELGVADANMKNELLGRAGVHFTEGMVTTVNPMALTLTGCKHLYESLSRGQMPQAFGSRKLADDTYEVQVFPIHRWDRLVAGKQKGFLNVNGKPRQVSPMNKPPGVIAISGAGNYSSSIELAMALFLENKAVVHKAHQLNETTDAVWEKIFAPLVARKALAFCDADQGREMSQLKGLTAIYFTGSTGVAHAIQDAASAPLVSECGGNNPCLIVPGDRPWTASELRHWAVQLASVGKLNGGAVCGRPQTFITSRSWPQREAFLDALRKAIVEETFACSTYYPGVDKTVAAFREHQPSAEVLHPEGGKHPGGDFIFIPNIGEDDFAVKNEAFCQVFSELPLETENDADDFLTKATAFCNDRLLGSLGCMVLVDDDTFAAHQERVHQAVHELRYGGIAVNSVPPNIWLNAYLTWSGYGETTEDLVSGVGNFGNGLNFTEVSKSVIIDEFGSNSFSLTNRRQFQHMLKNASFFAIRQSWWRFAKLVGQMVVDGWRKKDF